MHSTSVYPAVLLAHSLQEEGSIIVAGPRVARRAEHAVPVHISVDNQYFGNYKQNL